MWPEVEAAKKENRREIKLTGANVSERIDKNGGCLDEAIYKLTALNLLDVNDTSLKVISPQLKQLQHLQSLLLFRNKIEQLPATIGTLSDLKVLDLSGNQLSTLPAEFTKLRSLTTLNLSFNKLKSLDLSSLDKLGVCNLSGNELVEVPQFHTGQVHYLTDVNLEKNCIVTLPEALTQQQILRVLNVADNKIDHVPKYLSKCVKLKEIYLKGNPLKDKRLLKLVDQCRSKQVLDYVEKNGYQAPKVDPKATASGQSEMAEQDDTSETPEDDVQLKIMVHKSTENTLKASFSLEAKVARPYITLCIVRNYPVTDMKKFLQMQNSLHDNECLRREEATIATHDLSKIKGAVRYHAAPPGEILITPLGSATQVKVTAEKYYADLEHLADMYRKEKKRNTYSGVYKYITLVRGKELFAFLTDEEKVISLPPLTNSDETKISPTTTDMLLEVTSSVSHGSCVRIMNVLLERMLLLNVEVVPAEPLANGTVPAPGEKKKKSKSSKGSAAAGKVPSVRYDRSATLMVEQVPLFDSDGKLHAVFPGKGDIEGDEAKKIAVEMVAA